MQDRIEAELPVTACEEVQRNTSQRNNEQILNRHATKLDTGNKRPCKLRVENCHRNQSHHKTLSWRARCTKIGVLYTVENGIMTWWMTQTVQLKRGKPFPWWHNVCITCIATKRFLDKGQYKNIKEEATGRHSVIEKPSITEDCSYSWRPGTHTPATLTTQKENTVGLQRCCLFYA